MSFRNHVSARPHTWTLQSRCEEREGQLQQLPSPAQWEPSIGTSHNVTERHCARVWNRSPLQHVYGNLHKFFQQNGMELPQNGFRARKSPSREGLGCVEGNTIATKKCLQCVWSLHWRCVSRLWTSERTHPVGSSCGARARGDGHIPAYSRRTPVTIRSIPKGK
jgi:hypothetical protein